MISLRELRFKDWLYFHQLYNHIDIEKELPFKDSFTSTESFFWFVRIIFNLKSDLLCYRAICLNDKLIGMIFLDHYMLVHQTANISFDVKTDPITACSASMLEGCLLLLRLFARGLIAVTQK